MSNPPTTLTLFRQHLLAGASSLALVNGMEAAETVRAQNEAADFRARADAWIRANPNRARELAAKVEAARRHGGGDIEVGDVRL